MFISIPWPSRVILVSTYSDRYDVLDFLVEQYNYLQDQSRELQRKTHVGLEDNIPVAKKYQRHIYCVFKVGEPVLLGSKRIAHEYVCNSRYPRHLKTGIKRFRDKHPGSITIQKAAHDPLQVWKENQNIKLL